MNIQENINEIYDQYSIPPNLRQHMQRVAAFAAKIATNWQGAEPIDKALIIDACLLHDLGNIIKFDFDNFPELLGAEQARIEYWREVKTNMIAKYGNDEDAATCEMIKEIGVSPEVAFIVENWGFKNFTRIEESDNWNWKIAVYSDHRISPSGVVTLKQNLENKQKRYRISRHNSSLLSKGADGLFKSAERIEQELGKRLMLDIHKVVI